MLGGKVCGCCGGGYDDCWSGEGGKSREGRRNKDKQKKNRGRMSGGSGWVAGTGLEPAPSLPCVRGLWL